MSKLLHHVRNGTAKHPKTKRGSSQQHRILVRAYCRVYSGGGMFGYDTRIMAVQEPELFAYLTMIEREFASLPE